MTEESLFELVLLTPPQERSAILDRECADQPELRARVSRLVQEFESNGESSLPHLIEKSDATPEYTPAETVGKVIAGRYELLEWIGVGGMGEVWVAKQSEPVKRKVAVKLIRKGMDSRRVLARFDQERQALALMDHPNIAKVLDGGLTEAGQPFFVMELVVGRPLLKFCDEAKLGIRERLELFVPICQAVQHAHQKGIIHRDLKPANILVTLVDGKPTPKVIDFGVAKAVSGKLIEESLETELGRTVGTLEYMPPEQTGLSIEDVDTRADVYSLGVILYELLTGLRPFDSKRLRKAAEDEVKRIIREEEPPSLSSRLSTDESLASAAAVRGVEPKRLLSLCKGELDWIVQRCLQKDRNRRYETANGLGRDVQRFLTDDPVEARPVSTGYRFKKFLRRNKGSVVAAGLLFVTLTGTAGTTWTMMLRAEAAEKRESQRAEGERLAKIDAQQQREVALKAASAALLAKKQADEDRRVASGTTDLLTRLIGQLDPLATLFGQSGPSPKRSKDAFSAAAIGADLKLIFTTRPDLEIELSSTVGLAATNLGDWDVAEPSLERATELARKSGTVGIQVHCLRRLAWFRHLAGQLNDAEGLYREALVLLPESSPERGEIELGLGWALAERGAIQNQRNLYVAAEQLLRSALANGVTGDRAGAVHVALALLHFDRSDPKGAAVHLLEARRCISLKHAELFWEYLELNLLRRRSCKEAVPKFQRFLSRLREQFGERHPFYMLALGEAAGNARTADDTVEGIALIRRAIEIGRQVRPFHPRMVEALVCLAEEIRGADPNEARNLLDEANRIIRRTGDIGRWQTRLNAARESLNRQSRK